MCVSQSLNSTQSLNFGKQKGIFLKDPCSLLKRTEIEEEKGDRGVGTGE